MGILPSVVRNTLARVKRKAAKAGYSPEEDQQGLPGLGYMSNGKSLYGHFDKDGGFVPTRGWVKSKPEPGDLIAQWIERIEDACGRVHGLASLAVPPVDTLSDLLTVYSMGDPHLGLIGDAIQSGDDWDSDKMQAELLTAAAILVERSPPTTEAHIVNVGDFFHFDTPGKTTTAGTPQDTDLTIERMMDLGVGLSIALIELAKRRHKRVVYIAAKGNHDRVLVYALLKILAAHYANDPAVTIKVDRSPFIYWAWGNNLFGATHGDRPKKLTELEAIMARDCDRNGLWKVGTGQHREWLTGHVHHEQVKDLRNVKVRALRTLAPGSVWSHSEGYRSHQEMRADLYHIRYGWRGSLAVGIEEIRDRMEQLTHVDSNSKR